MARSFMTRPRNRVATGFRARGAQADENSQPAGGFPSAIAPRLGCRRINGWNTQVNAPEYRGYRSILEANRAIDWINKQQKTDKPWMAVWVSPRRTRLGITCRSPSCHPTRPIPMASTVPAIPDGLQLPSGHGAHPLCADGGKQEGVAIGGQGEVNVRTDMPRPSAAWICRRSSDPKLALSRRAMARCRASPALNA